jgi:hypothetical protein
LRPAEHLERAIAREIGGLAGRAFAGRNEFRVEAQAFFSEGDQRRRFGRIWPGREHSSRGPGGFAARLLPIEHRDAQFFGHELEGD